MIVATWAVDAGAVVTDTEGRVEEVGVRMAARGMLVANMGAMVVAGVWDSVLEANVEANAGATVVAGVWDSVVEAERAWHT